MNKEKEKETRKTAEHPLHQGLYEQVISEKVGRDLERLDPSQIDRKSIDPAELPRILSDYAAQMIHQQLSECKTVQEQSQLLNSLLSVLGGQSLIPETPEQLLTILEKQDPWLLSHKSAAGYPRPQTSLARSSLFTGSRHEPTLVSEFKKEIASAQRIDMLVSFIRWSGLRLILDELREFAYRGGKLRLITTAYMGATELKAVEALSALPNAEVRISYDKERTRLHAKAYLYYRSTGWSTAYVGSSNLSNPAISSGLEWNMKLTRNDQPETMDKIEATFASYWNAPEFEPYDSSQREKLRLALQEEHSANPMASQAYSLDVRPYPYQQEILDQLEAERTLRHHTRNLVVAATGTGKTVIAALDYRRYVQAHPGAKNRLLFVAHREEILRQSLQTFRAVLKDANFADLHVGDSVPLQADHLFVSIQSLNSAGYLDRLDPKFYNYIVVDEFHHAAAPTYLRLLRQMQPDIFLGLSATPERMDGKDVLEMFDGKIAAEIRLPEAISRKLLVPFHYFGVTDETSLESVRWVRGGYDKSELSALYNHNIRRADQIVRAIEDYCSDLSEIKALGFCVGVAHAEFMADYFNQHGLASIALSAKSDKETRKRAADDLKNGKIHFIFSVDLYNEGVDIPEVNTVLFLRPTESLTIFLQQLGRGLRLSEGKECLTILDFIGAANRKYDFVSKFSALLPDLSKDPKKEIENGFPSLPPGCFVQLEKVAQNHVLNSIQNAIVSRKQIQQQMKSFEADTGLPLNLKNFLERTKLEPSMLYKQKLGKMRAGFYDLACDAGLFPELKPVLNQGLSSNFYRLAAMDSGKWISFLKRILSDLDHLDPGALSKEELRMMDMLFISLFGTPAGGFQSEKSLAQLEELKAAKAWQKEMKELLDVQYERINVSMAPWKDGIPLEVHATYTRDQILSALDFDKPQTVREGVRYLPSVNADVFFITLNKSEKEYSPTTLYQDYSISEDLFHWQSQSTTNEDSPTGQRYIHHEQMGSEVLLFVREYKKDPLTKEAMPYTFMGPARYVSHEGSRPMNIVWKLDHPIPARYLKKTSTLIS